MWGRGVDPRALTELREQYHALLQRTKQLEDDLLALEGKYERLRGRVYGVIRHDQGESKAEILKRMGYTRGNAVAPPQGSGNG